MSYLEFDISGGNNLNSGIYNTSNTYTSTGGNFDGTSVFTPTDGSTPASSISIGDYVSLYNTGDTVTRAVAQVTNVAAGVNGAVTVSTTIKYGTFPTSNSGSRALKKGGTWADLGVMAANGVMNTGAVPQSTRLNIKAATYANTSVSRSCGVAGTAQFPFRVQGYKTSPADQEGNFTAVAGTDIPLITFTTGSMGFSGSDTTVANLDITSAATGSTLTMSASRWKAQQIRATNTSSNAGAIAFSSSQIGVATACNFTCPTTATKTISITTGITTFYGCIINGGITGLLNAVAASGAYDCMFYGQAGDCISTNNNFVCMNSGFYAPIGNGINFTGSGSGAIVANCYFSTVNQAAKAAINNTSGTNIENPTLVANAFFNCTANYQGFQESYQFVDNGTLASEAFASPTTQNFAIVAAYRGLGYPGQFENFSASRGYMTFGAEQSQSSGVTLRGWQGGFGG